METKITIPKDKIGGERFGQLIYNALRYNDENLISLITDSDIGYSLFDVSNKNLQKIIDNYIEKQQHG